VATDNGLLTTDFSVKQIIAVVKPYLAEKIVEALSRSPLEALSVHEVKGYGRQKSYLHEYGQSDYALAFLPKVEIEAWVDDSRAAEVIEQITKIAHTGRMGDGKIFVLPCDDWTAKAALASQKSETVSPRSRVSKA
jgi:nitrogen regulatory protein PII